MSSASSPASYSTAPYPHYSNFDVVIPVPPSQPRTETALSTTPDRIDDDEDDELSDEAVTRLLRAAEERMRNATSVSKATGDHDAISIKLPRLDPGASLPKPPINSHGAVSRIEDRTVPVPEAALLANSTRPVVGGATNKKKSKKEPPPSAGAAWYDMPRTELTDEFKRDFLLIKHRNVLDPHRHYKKDSSGIPQYSQVGTVIEGSTEFFNSRINRRERKKTILDEVLADNSSRQRFKRKYDEIQKSKKSGKKEFYKNLKAKRNKTAAKVT